MNAKQRRMRISKRNYYYDYFEDGMRLVIKKPNFKSKKQKQYSKIRIAYFVKKIIEHFSKQESPNNEN